MKTLQYSFIALFAALILSACGNSAAESSLLSNNPEEVSKAIQEKKALVKSLLSEIEALETHLAKIDTTKRLEKKIEITTRKVRTKDFAHFIEVQGNIVPAQDPAVASSETGGRIMKMLVKESDYVTKGQLIAKVDLESIRKSIAEIDASLDLAKDMFQRQEKLWKQNIGSEAQFLQAKNQVERLEKTKERLDFELTKANVIAPASGHIEKVMTKEGEICGPGSPIVQIVNSNVLKVVAQVPENYLGKVKQGDLVDIKFPAINQSQNARVSMISRMINSNNRTFEVEALVESRGGLIKPNLLATMMIQDYLKPKSLVIYSELIMQDISGNNYVMVKEGEKALKKVITIGQSYNNETEVLSGLTGEEFLIVKGARQVIEGDLVTVIGEEPEVVIDKK